MNDPYIIFDQIQREYKPTETDIEVEAEAEPDVVSWIIQKQQPSIRTIIFNKFRIATRIAETVVSDDDEIPDQQPVLMWPNPWLTRWMLNNFSFLILVSFSLPL